MDRWTNGWIVGLPVSSGYAIESTYYYIILYVPKQQQQTP